MSTTAVINVTRTLARTPSLPRLLDATTPPATTPQLGLLKSDKVYDQTVLKSMGLQPQQFSDELKELKSMGLQPQQFSEELLALVPTDASSDEYIVFEDQNIRGKQPRFSLMDRLSSEEVIMASDEVVLASRKESLCLDGFEDEIVVTPDIDIDFLHPDYFGGLPVKRDSSPEPFDRFSRHCPNGHPLIEDYDSSQRRNCHACGCQKIHLQHSYLTCFICNYHRCQICRTDSISQCSSLCSTPATSPGT